MLENSLIRAEFNGADVFDRGFCGSAGGGDGGGVVRDKIIRFSHCGGGIFWWDEKFSDRNIEYITFENILGVYKIAKITNREGE